MLHAVDLHHHRLCQRSRRMGAHRTQTPSQRTINTPLALPTDLRLPLVSQFSCLVLPVVVIACLTGDLLVALCCLVSGFVVCWSLGFR